MSYQWWGLERNECRWVNQGFPVRHLAMKQHLDELLLLFSAVEISLIQILECADDHRLQERVY